MKPSKSLIAVLWICVTFGVKGEDIAFVWPGLAGGSSELITHSNLLFISGGYSPSGAQVWDLKERRFVRTLHSDYGGHAEMVSPDGRFLAGGHTMVWDVTTGALRTAPLLPAYGSVQFVGFQTRSNRAVLLWEGRMRIWELDTDRMIDGPAFWGVNVVPFGAPDGENAGLIVNSEIHVVSLSTFEDRLIARMGQSDAYPSAAFSQDGKKIAAVTYWWDDGRTNQMIHVYDVSSGQLERTFTGHAAQISGVAFAPNRPVLASASKDGSLFLWDLNTGERLKTFSLKPRSYAPRVAFSGDGATLVFGNLIVDQESGAAQSLVEQFCPVDNVEINADGSLIASQHHYLMQEGHLFDAKKGRHLATLYDAPMYPSGAAVAQAEAEPVRWSSYMRSYQPIYFTSDGEKVFVGRRIHSAVSGAAVGMLPPVQNGSVKGFAENWYYTSWFNDDIAQLRSYADGSVIRRLVSATTGGSSAIATSSSLKLIATTGYYFKGGDFVDSSIKIWDSGTGGLITTLSNRQWLPYRLVFSKDERLVASISDMNNPEVSVWNISDGRELLRLREKVPPSAGIDFLPDSRTLVYGSMKALEFWDVFSGNRVATITKEASFITAVSAAGDGKTVAVGRMDGTVVVYNTPTTDPLTMTATTDGLSLNFKARSSVVYVVEASSDLKSWRNVTTVTGTGENVRVGVNPEETTFYRLR